MEINITTSEEELSIDREIMEFISSINSLADTFPIMKLALDNSYEISRKELTEILMSLPEITKINLAEITSDESTEVKQVPLSPESINLLHRHIPRLERLLSAKELLMRSLVISLVSQYDAFLSAIIRVFFFKRPEIFNLSEKNITFKQLQSFDSIEDAQQYLIEQEIDKILRDSHMEHIEWLEKKFHVSLKEETKLWPTFIEITERRNIFVHNSGIISQQYLNNCKKFNITLEEDSKIGKELKVTDDYFVSAYECIFEIGVKIAQVLWRKVLPKEILNADTHLNSVCYSLLDEERFKLACTILDFATTRAKYHDERHKRLFIINKAQAYKWDGNPQKAREIIHKEDWSAASDDFKLAISVISDDFEKANDLVKKIGKSGAISQNDYRRWPLFREYKKTEQFLQIFEEIFGESFYILEQDNLFKFNEELEEIGILDLNVPEEI